MSAARIAGAVSPRPQITADVQAMLGAFRGVASTPRTDRGGRAAFGVVGRTACNGRFAARGPLMAVVDGRIYNAPDLLGREASAADVILELVERDGVDAALGRVNGDFALAVFDESAGRLWLARDRFGIKPLYYAQPAGDFAFASQPRALLRWPGVPRTVNRAFVARYAGLHYRTFDNDPSTSPFADIAQVPAAHVLERGPDGATRLRRYWSLDDLEDFDESFEALADRYRDLLRDAVRIRFRAARAPVFTLSGGMDSSSVLASAAWCAGRPLPAVSTVYHDPTFDESADIQSMMLGGGVAEWHQVRIGTPDVFALVEAMVRDHDEPVATATWLSHYLLCKEAARQGFGAVFGGLGGDELNAGEYEHFFFHFADLRRAGDEPRLTAEIASWAAFHDHPIYRKNRQTAEDGLRRLVDLAVPGRCRVDRARLERYRGALDPGFYDLAPFEPEMDHPFRSYLKNRTYQDIGRETTPCCLRAEDRHATVFGLEHFDPFLDHRLVEFMFRVPGALKIRNGVTKVLLREAMKGVLPDATRTRVKKTGWNAPAHVWFSGAALEMLRDRVASRRFQERGIYDVSEVDRIIGEHAAIVRRNEPRENHMMFLWQLTNLDAWLNAVEGHPA